MPPHYTLKSSVSAKQRTEAGDEIFVSVGMEATGVTAENLDTEQAALTERTANWLEERLLAAGASVFGGATEDGEVGDETEEEGEEADADEEEGEAITVEDVAALDKAGLDELIDAHELDVSKKLKLADKRAAIIAALFDETEEEEEEAEEEAEAEEEGEEEFVPYEESELAAMKLADLQTIATEWGVTVKTKPGADLKAKKAATVKAILKAQEEAAEVAEE